MERWLVSHGFVLQPGRKTSHRRFVNGACGITVPGHGPADLTKKHVALIRRALTAHGYDPQRIREDLGL